MEFPKEQEGKYLNKAVLSGFGGVECKPCYIYTSLVGRKLFTFVGSIPIVLSSMTIPAENGSVNLSPTSRGPLQIALYLRFLKISP